MQKEVQLSLDIWAPPLFVITKQLETTLDNLFYKTLEERGVIREAVIKFLKETHSGKDWAERLGSGLESN